MTPGLTAQFCGELVDLNRAPLPPAVVSAARRSLLNVLATAVGASRSPAVDIVVALALEHSGAGHAPVPGRSERLDAMSAALAAGLAAHLDDFDDTHLDTVIHPGAAPMAAAVSTAARRHPSGSALLRAFALGCEAQLRVGLAMSPEHYDDGWHITGTCGPIGAAVTAALLAGLEPPALARAVGVAASQSLGIREAFGTMTKTFHVGKAASNGVLAADLAGSGFTGPTDVFEDSRGFFAVLSPRGSRPEALLHDLGQRWELERNTFKPYPCGIVSHPAIDAALALAAQLPHLDLVEIVARVHPLVPELTGNLDPTTGLEARFSAAHGIAVALVDGEVGLPQYTDERAADPEVAAIRQRVRFDPDPACPRDAAVVTAVLAGGRAVTERVEHARGSLARPLDDADLAAKVDRLVTPVLNGGTARLLDAVGQLDDADSADDLLHAIVPDPKGPAA